MSTAIINIASSIGRDRVNIGKERSYEHENIEKLLLAALCYLCVSCLDSTSSIGHCLILTCLQEWLLRSLRSRHNCVIEDKFDSNHGYKHEQHLVSNGRKDATLLDFKIGRNPLRNQVKAVGVVAVREIIYIVSSYRINSIINSAHVGSLARAREIRLQRRRTRVQVTHGVSIITP